MSKVLTLKECCEFQEGYVNPSQKNPRYFGGNIKWLRASDLNGGHVFSTERTLSDEGYASAGKSAKMFAKDTIAISKSGTIGALGILKDEMCGNRAVINISVRNEKADLMYVFYTLKYKKEELESKAGGSIQKNLYVSALETLGLNHSEKVEQAKISQVLAAIDSKIELNNRINAELEAMAKTLYDYWFVQFDFPFDFAQGKPAANGKPYKSSGGKMEYNPTLKREIPVGWDVAVVANVLGKTPSSNKVLNQEIMTAGSIPVIDQSQDYICGFTDDITALIRPTEPHVVFGDHTRAVKLVNFEYARGADGTQILLSNDSRMPGYLLYHAVSDIDLSNYGYARHFKFLKDSKIILPNEAIAARYHEVVAPWYEKIKGGIFENQHLMQLRDWLLPMLMNGQVTVHSAATD